MCVARTANANSKQAEKEERPTASDVPLGAGLADAARLSIMNRRERIRQAVD